MRYDWSEDKRQLKVGGDTIPPSRCFHCGRIFLNSSLMDAFCRDCHKAMSVSKYGPEHDFDFFMHGKKALDRRETLEPIDFEMEDGFKRASKDDFKLANGKALSEEEAQYRRLFNLQN